MEEEIPFPDYPIMINEASVHNPATTRLHGTASGIWHLKVLMLSYFCSAARMVSISALGTVGYVSVSIPSRFR